MTFIQSEWEFLTDEETDLGPADNLIRQAKEFSAGQVQANAFDENNNFVGGQMVFVIQTDDDTDLWVFIEQRVTDGSMDAIVAWKQEDVSDAAG